VHDVGKTSVDPVLLEKATRLTDDESAIIRRHPQTGHDELVGVAHPTVADAVLSHHERWDGRGFPNGIKKTEIPLYAIIIFVADAYDVMTTGRSYRTPMTMVQAGEELARLSGQQFDPKVVDAFASVERRLLSTPTLQNATLPDVKMR
jgi:HD-GYP domain-containing protein (c-di-GMP phosphodiesterase class II)